MSNRATRREILAAIVLAHELPAPNEIKFRESSVSVELDCVADLYAWLSFFRIAERRVATQPYTRAEGVADAGQTSTLANVYSERNWRGWRVHLSALDPVGADRPLDDDTRAALAEVAAGPDVECTLCHPEPCSTPGHDVVTNAPEDGAA